MTAEMFCNGASQDQELFDTDRRTHLSFVHDSVLWGDCELRKMWTEWKYSQSRRLDASPSVGKSEFCPVSSVKWSQASNEMLWVLYIPISIGKI